MPLHVAAKQLVGAAFPTVLMKAGVGMREHLTPKPCRSADPAYGKA